MSAFTFDAAIVRRPGARVIDGLRAGGGGSPTFAGVLAEHDAYVAALEAAGVAVEVLEPLDDYPDAIFVEDPALTFPEGAILLRPGAASRAGEVAALAPALRRRFATVLKLPRGHVEGGDVLVTPDRVMVGLSARTDREGAEALLECLAALGRHGAIVETPADVLHFKSDCSMLDDRTVIATARLAASGVFDGFDVVLVPDGEEAAANALRVNGVVLAGSGYPRTIELLRSRGFTVVPLPTSEVGKVDAGLSCMSLRWRR